MIQDIAPRKLYNEFRNKKPDKNDYIAVFTENKMLVKETGNSIRMPQFSELPAEIKKAGQETGHAGTDDAEDFPYLFCIEQEDYYLYLADNPVMPDAQAGLRLMSLSDVRSQAGREFCFAAYTAWHLCQWYRRSRFCGRCGAKTRPDKKERMLRCEACGNQIYPVISPAVIVAVTNGNQILLTRYANRAYKRYALIAGFTEIGETAEDTVRREVMEETGLRVKNIRYYKSQPWGIDGNLLLGYFAELDGSSEIVLDENELAAAEWADREQLKDMDDSFSLTREMMRVFYEGRAEGW